MIRTDEDPSLRIESFAIINLHGVSTKPRPDFRENVRGGEKIFRGGATMISTSRQRVK